jgi:ATP-dependent helicase/DNAse subunit B
MSHLARHLFGNPRKAEPAETTEGIEILAAARPIGEMELVGARIKRLIVEEGVKPDDIAVVFRAPQDPRSLAAEVFNRLGLPISWEQGVPLDRVPIMRALVALLKLDMEDWPFKSLLAVIASNYFQPSWPAWKNGCAAVELDCQIRKLQIPQGRKAILNDIRRTDFQSVPRADEDQANRNIDESAFEQIENLSYDTGQITNLSYEVLALLAAAFDRLPQKATLPDWANAWEKLARETGLLRGLDWNGHSDDSSVQKSDALAWKKLLSVLSESDRLAGWLKQHPPELSREEAFRALVDILGSERLPDGQEESGRVRVLSASSVRSLHIPYLFLAGLSEKAFPQPDREDRLYSEAECARLIEHNLPLVTRTERNREEMLLFYEAVTRATKRLYLSYPALDDSAQPLSPSPFLLEVEQACGADRIAKTEATDFRPVPKTTQPLSQSEFRIAAMAEALEGNYRWLAGLKQSANHGTGESHLSASHNLFAGLELTMLRQDRERFGPAEGILSGEKMRKVLHAEFPADRTFSVTELESYAKCPYRYLLEKILKIEPVEDLALETDYLERGQSVHEVLAVFHQKVNASRGRPTSPAKLDEVEFQQFMQAAMDEALPSSSGNSVRAALREIDRRLISKWLTDYRRQHEEYDKLWFDHETPPTPEFFEISFGLSKHPSKTWAIEQPLELPDGADVIRLSGRIDRVDTGFTASHVVFNILDYKTGSSAKFSLDEFMHGAALQLPLYAIAVMELFLNDRDAVPWQAGYWFVAKDGFNYRQALKMYHRGENGLEELEEEWEMMRSQIGDIVAGLVHSIRNGFFPVFNRNDRCTSSCPLNTICRINQIRSLEKTCLPTVMGEGK